MIVSIINWQPLYWVDHPNADEVFSITKEEFQKIQSWLAELVGTEVIDFPIIEKSEEKLSLERRNELISKIQWLQTQIITNNNEYIAIRDIISDDQVLKDMKLDKLAYEWDQLLIDFETIVGELVTEFGEEALINII